MAARRTLSVVVKRHRSGDVIHRGTTALDPRDHAAFTHLFRSIVRADGWDLYRIGEFVMDVLDGGRPLMQVTDGGA